MGSSLPIPSDPMTEFASQSWVLPDQPAIRFKGHMKQLFTFELCQEQYSQNTDSKKAPSSAAMAHTSRKPSMQIFLSVQ